MSKRKTAKPRLRAVRSATATPSNSELDRVVSEAEAAKILGYSKDTLRRQFRAGTAPARVRLSAARTGYRLSSIYRWLEARTEKPGTRESA
jgi:predicted DNA-binding transcriptional regulator AlpA